MQKSFLIFLAVLMSSLQALHAQAGLNSSGNPSLAGQSVTFTAAVSGAVDGITPTGSFTFNDGTIDLGNASLTPSGTASFTTTTLPLGPHSITATYSGDQHYNAETVGPIAQTVVAGSLFTVSASPTFLSVKKGMSADVVLGLTASPGFSGNISFTCSNLPVGANCSFSPPAISPMSGTASSSLTITTTDATRIALGQRQPSPPIPMGPAISFGLFVTALVLVPVALVAYFDTKSSGQPVLSTAIVGLALIFLLNGCKHRETLIQQGTPPGTYNVTIAATDGTIVQANSVVLSVRE